MDVTRMLATLREELESLNAAIATLERLQQGDRRRGRPTRLVSARASRDMELTGKQPVKTERRHP
jgi:prefoldin subunit 5